MVMTDIELAHSVAIVGMSGRFPGAKNISEFWQNLCNGVESIRSFSDQELLDAGIPVNLLKHPDYVKAKPILDNVENFDADFFGYTPREAELIDPQQRLFLECSWEALEHAGYDSQQYDGWIGVYGGSGAPVYAMTNLQAGIDVSMSVAIANAADYLATRVSYKLDLQGPSFTVQAACATSLLAIHTACQGLLDHQCDIALAGGASIDLPQQSGYLFEKGGIRSPDGHCRTFDADAHGTVFGNGVGVVALKRLDDAIADGDFIYAVIRGSATNNDGASKIGYTAPSIEGQAQVVALAQRSAGVDPATIAYVEAHGTGTEIGDPIEIAALTKAFRSKTQKRQFCAIGSVKPNIGHVDAAAGVAGLIKTTLALHHKQIPPTLHFKRPNPKIDFVNSPFYVNTTLAKWPAQHLMPLRAAVSSFGIGGTNVHAILEEAPTPELSSPAKPWQLLTISAKTETALKVMTKNLANHLREYPAINLADVGFTLQVGRKRFPHRRIVICRDIDEAITELETLSTTHVSSCYEEQTDRPVAFMFPGQGAQYLQMGQDLYQHEPLFREYFDRCSTLLYPLLGIDLPEVIFATEGSSPGAEERLQQTNFAQPALFAIEYALAQCWIAWGVQPQAMIGHSIGEYVAACLAGVFSLEDALTLVAVRGRLMQQMPTGAMLAVSLSESELLPFLNQDLAIAAINGPVRCVVAGPIHAIASLEQILISHDVGTRRLHTSHAFHSSMMEPVLTPFMEAVSKITLSPPTIPYISNVTGTWITTEEAVSPEYWVKQLRHAVRFADGVRELMQTPNQIMLEVGPGRTLGNLIRQYPNQSVVQVPLASLPHPQDKTTGFAFILENLGKLWLAGVKIDWAKVHAESRRNRVPLPTYPFERQRYWVDLSTQATNQAPARSLDKKSDIADWFYLPTWKRSLLPASFNVKMQKCWLIFSDTCGVGTALADKLQKDDQQVLSVNAGNLFTRLDSRTFVINPDRPDDYVTLLTTLSEEQLLPDLVFHLWSVTSEEQERGNLDTYQSMQVAGFNSLLYLAQALGRQNSDASVSIKVISNGMQQVAEGELRWPEKATLLGPCRTIPQEYPHISCQSIDILLPQKQESETRLALVNRLIDECAENSSQDVLAYRGRYRFVQSFEPIQVAKTENVFPYLRTQGTYLITGGLGAIGMVIANELAKAVKAKLVLLGRSTFPERTNWEDWLIAHDEEDTISQKIRKLQMLETLGAEVMTVNADISNLDEMRTAIDTIRARFGVVHGVIHSAGIAGGGLMQLKTIEQAQKIFAPKVQAIHVLEKVLADQQLDFMMLCSSTLAFMGEIGQVDYCAANAFLDAYAIYNTSTKGIPTLSINWEGWLEAGMAAAAIKHFSATTLEHSFFSQCHHEPSGTIGYTVKFDESHWLFAEHKIRGIPTLPGTAHLELARAAYMHQTNIAEIELCDVYFFAPLMIHSDEIREIRVTLSDAHNGVTEFRVVSRADSNATWQEFSRGTIKPLDDALPEARDIRSIQESCNIREIDITEMPMQDLNGLDYWGPRWQSFSKVTIGHQQALALLQLSSEFQDDVEQFDLHPALLDVATAIGLPGMLSADDSYLPLSYDRIKIRGRLPSRIYSHVRYDSNTTNTKEILPFDVTLLDENGQVLVDITRFILRRVTEANLALKTIHVNKPDSTKTIEKGILLEEGADAFRRLLAHDIFPQVVVISTDLQSAIENTRQSARDTTFLESLPAAHRSGSTHARPALKTEYAAPTNEIEQQLADIWQAVLGIEQVGIHDDYFELGGDSLLALLIISRMRNSFQIELAPHQFFEQPTIADMAKQITATKIPITNGVESKSGKPLQALLVPLHVTTNATPLFCIHPMGGQIYFYQEIAKHLGKDHPIYAIQSPEIAKLPQKYADLSEMATAYINTIKSIQPTGPYHLLGWSSGGLFAMAIATALEKRQEKVNYVGLLDSRPVDFFETKEKLFVAVTSVILSSVRGRSFKPGEIQELIFTDKKLEALYTENEAHVLPYLLRKLIKADFSDEQVNFLSHQHDVTHRHVKLLTGYLPEELKAPLHIGWANDSSGNSALFDWEKFSNSKNSTTYFVEGSHYTMLQGGNAKAIAEAIRSFLVRQMVGQA
ncbi:MAG: beta-ketoacyl synthase N-terminal-like domain-containing protein [Pseudomonadota bacterium]